jgi:hypothetical protein
MVAALGAAPAWTGEARMRAIEGASAASAKKNYAGAAKLLDGFVEKQAGGAEAAGLAATARAYERRAALQKAVPSDAAVRALLLDLLAPSDPYLDAADELDPRSRELLALLRKGNAEAAALFARRTVRVSASGAGIDAGATDAFVAGAVARLAGLGYAAADAHDGAGTDTAADTLAFELAAETDTHHAGTPGEGAVAAALAGLKGCRFTATGRWSTKGAEVGRLVVRSAGLHPDAQLGLLTAAETAAATVGVAWIKSFLVAQDERESTARVALSFVGEAPEPLRALVAASTAEALRQRHRVGMVADEDGRGTAVDLVAGEAPCPRTAVLRSPGGTAIVHVHAIKDGARCERTSARLGRLIADRLAPR